MEIMLKPSKDQHITINEKLINRIVEYAEISNKDIVLEIGGGTGNLTEKLIEKAKNLIVVEIDKELVEILKQKFSKKENIKIVEGNILGIEIPWFNKSVSSLPYNICEPLLWKLIRLNFDLLVFVIPKGFHEILNAKENDEKYSKVSLMVKYFFDLEFKELVKAEDFYPKPKVESVVVVIKPKKLEENKVNFIIKELFLQYDKKLKNALREAFVKYNKNTKKKAKEIIEKLNLNEKMLSERISHLSLDSFKELIEKLKSL
ncbi:ribosomal RNA small subunit methyltransferase A [Candidatus Woesearchaeota archaeon]|nr:ribosomal RNA small subunit methyltransferase A [Candidatus Woesearchaeota archaeon]